MFQEKGGAFAGMFKKASRPADGPNAEDVSSPTVTQFLEVSSDFECF